MAEWLCKVCDTRFDRNLVHRNLVVEKNVCPTCLEWHHWCNRGKHAKLRSEFSASSTSKYGLQHYCIDCQKNYMGTIRVGTCRHCEHEFVVFSTQGESVKRPGWMCFDCRNEVKLCQRCDTVQPVDEFVRSNDRPSGRSAHCRTCTSKSWFSQPHEDRRNSRLLKAYGLSYSDYNAMLAECGGVCTICKRPETQKTRQGLPKPLAVDHCHATGAVRGLLCGACNSALGYMEDDVDRLRAAAAYVEQAAAKHLKAC